MSCNGNHFLSHRIDSVWKMFFYYLLGNSDLPKHAQLIYLSMAQTYITIPTYSHYCTDHFTSLHKQTTSRNTLSTLIIRPQYNQQYKYQHPAEIRVPTWSREYWFVKSVNLYRLLLQRNCFLQKMCFSFRWSMNWARPWITCLHIVHGYVSYIPTHSLWGTMPNI